MKNGFQFLLSGCSALALLACGDDVTKMTNVTNETTGMEVAASADSLGTCDSAAIGKTVFASSESSVYICADSGWVPLSKTSASGKDGADGENGSDGASCTVAALSDSSGYKVVCGGDSVGVILNGADGKDGASGENGSDGKDGANGTSCTVAALSDGSGYKIVCGGDSVGVVLNGTDGAAGNSCSAKALADGSGYKIVCGGDSVGVILNGTNGKDGADGKDGTSGNSCSAKALADGSGYKIVCGGDSVGIILNGTNGKDGKDGASGENGCRLASDSSGVVKIVCAASDTVTLYKAICGVEAYDPAEKFCFADSLYPLCGGNRYNAFKEHCKNETVSEGYGEFVDARDGQVYKMVRIGSQIWMAENLNYNYNEGNVNSSCYKDSSVYCKKYGRLYTFDAAIRACPEGWHLPKQLELNTFKNYLTPISTGDVGYALKSTSGWTAYDGEMGGSNAFGFGALPAGRFHAIGTPKEYESVQQSTYFWSSSENSKGVVVMYLRYNSSELYIDITNSKNHKYSIRCIKD